ncbi:MAG TPA: porin [Tabrizicola sp.]|nr:porin [Tabrizicola sp.]
MKTPLILFLALSPSIAAAQSFEGAAAELQYQRYDDGAGFDVDSLEGYMDASWTFGLIGAQVGLTLGKEIDSSDDIDLRQYNGLAAHLTMDASDSLRLGVMALTDNRGSGVSHYAAEALYLAGPVRVEGRLGDSLDTDDYTLFEARGSYAFGAALTARAGYHFSDYGTDGSYRVMSLGAGYQVNDGLEVYADLSRHKNDFGGGEVYRGDIVNLGVRFGLGGDPGKLFTYQPLP